MKCSHQRRFGALRNVMMMLPVIASLLVISTLGACVSSESIITGTPLAPLSTSKVKVYSTPPASFKEIAVLKATSNDLLGINQSQGKEVIIQRLKSDAAALGANGVLIRALDRKHKGIIGSAYGLSGTTVDQANNSSTVVSNQPDQGIHAMAIYVLEEDSP